MSITVEEVKQELRKCTNVEDQTGFYHFLKNYIYVPHPTKGEIKFGESMYSWQQNAAKEFLGHKFIISMKPRQVGFSTIVSAYALWRALFFRNQTIVIISLGLRESQDFLERIFFQYEKLPEWLKTPTKEYAKHSIHFKNGSKIRSLPNGPNVARGLSGSMIITDEFAFYEKTAGKILASAIPALGMGINTDFTNRTLPSQFFVISTLPEVSQGNEYMRLLNEAREKAQDAQFHLINVDVSDIPEYQDSEWHKRMKSALGDRKYRTEILCEENYNIEQSFLPQRILDEMEAINPIRTDFLYPDDVDDMGYPKDMKNFHNYKEGFDETNRYMQGLWIWQNPRSGVEYGIAGDVATGRAGDYSAFHVFDLATFEQVAEYKNRINTEDYKKILEAVAIYYNNAKMSVEANSMGESICQYFGNTINYENFFWSKKGRGKKRAPGFYLGQNRGNVLANFETRMVNREPKINGIRTINELRTFGWTTTGRAEGISNNDDLVMSLAEFCFLRETFFSTDKDIASNLMYGDFFEEELKEEEEKTRSNHYLSDKYDMDEETDKFLEGLRKMGASINPKDLQKFAR